MRTRIVPRWVLLTLGVALALGGSAAAENWPRFRGPNGTGISADKDVPVQWNDKEGILWKTALPGKGNSSPVVWGDRVFVETAPDATERRLLCLDANDGRVLWAKSVPGTNGRIVNKKNTLASSTPATDGERVYVLFWDGTEVALYAYDFQGSFVWKYELGSFTSQHGPGASPMVYKGKVYLNNDQDKFKDDGGKEERSGFPGRTSRLVALDAGTGKLLWQKPRTTFRACYSTPFIHEPTGQPPELIVASTAGITGYDPETGAEKWNWTWAFRGMALRTVASPILADGIVFASSGDGSGARHMVAVRKGDHGDVTETNLIWQTRKDVSPYVPSLLAWGEHVYYVSDRKGKAGCLVAKTGAEVWAEDLPSRADISASPVLIDGKIYVIGEDGEVYVYPAAPSFKLLAQNSLGEGVRATPAVANGRLFIRGEQHLFCIGKPARK